MKKVIGICLTQSNSELSREFVRNMYIASKKNNTKIIVFNSVVDFSDNRNSGARYVYYSIPYNKLNALVILHETLFDSSLVEKIIRDAKKNNVPVIMARKYDPRCYSVIGEYEDTYTELLKTVIKEKNIKSSYYIAGRDIPETDYDSKIRIHCYRNALEESGLSFNKDNVFFGGYFEYRTKQAVEKMFSKSEEIPDAIFCANDIMAQEVINILTEKGYNVPDDVCVTGFDGLECYRCSSPNLTTCKEEMDVLSNLIFDILKKHEENSLFTNAFYYGYKPVFSESCGYENEQIKETLVTGKEVYSTLRYNYAGEEMSQKWLDKVLNNPSVDDLYKLLPEYVFKDFSVAMAPCEVARIINKRYYTLDEKLIVFSFDEKTQKSQSDKFLMSSLVPDCDKWMEDDTVCYVTGVFIDEICYGVIFEKGVNIDKLGFKTQRHAYTINNALKACVIKDL